MRTTRLLLPVLLCTAACGNAQPVPEPSADGRPAIAVPQLTGRVVDRAGLLPPAEESRLTRELAGLERRTTDQMVVVTLESLRDAPIEQWGIGQADKDNGVLLLVAPNERRVRIEVGYGLETRLTDPICQEIIDQQILPPSAVVTMWAVSAPEPMRSPGVSLPLR